VAKSGEIEIRAIPGEPLAPPAEQPTQAPAQYRSATFWRELLEAMGIVGIATLVALALRPHLVATNLAMVYLLGVVAVASRYSRRVAVVCSFLSVAAFDFFCVPPYLTFRVSEPNT